MVNVKHCGNWIKIGVHSPFGFGLRFPVEFEAFFQKKIGAGLLHTGVILKQGLPVISAGFFLTDMNRSAQTPGFLF